MEPNETNRIEDTKHGIQAFAMFHYQSLLDHGLTVDQAKAETADLLEQQYNQFTERGNMDKKTLGNLTRRIDKIAAQAKAVATEHVSARPLYNDLQALQAYVRRNP